MEEKTIIQMRETFLPGTSIAKYLDPATSIYDLASMMFPGRTIMLREHFRCVEPIIRFSSRHFYPALLPGTSTRHFYKDGLVPLRVPTADHRLDPPLIDIYIKHGQRRHDLNEAEAKFIVAEIKHLPTTKPSPAARSA